MSWITCTGSYHVKKKNHFTIIFRVKNLYRNDLNYSN